MNAAIVVTGQFEPMVIIVNTTKLTDYSNSTIFDNEILLKNGISIKRRNKKNLRQIYD